MSIGRAYSPEDLSSPWAKRLGEDVVLSDGTEGFLHSVTEDGLVSIEGYDGLCAALIPAADLGGMIVSATAAQFGNPQI